MSHIDRHLVGSHRWTEAETAVVLGSAVVLDGRVRVGPA
jgi:hypothetical protein